MNEVKFDNNGYIPRAEIGALDGLTDQQLRALAYQFARELAHRHDALYDGASSGLDKTFYLSERVARYLLSEDITSPDELRVQLEEEELPVGKLVDALSIVADAFRG